MEFLMSNCGTYDRVNKLTHDGERGLAVAVFSTYDGSFYAVDIEGCGALKFLTEEKLVLRQFFASATAQSVLGRS
jgi:hypothetical protein